MTPIADPQTSMLLTALRSARISPNTDFSVSPPPSVSIKSNNLVKVKSVDDMKEKIIEWLDSVGLKVNPFAVLDASRDPFIPFYLIDHDEFRSISGDFTSFMFASPGSGKSAFRVRLARDCRVGKDGRRIFPIVYNLPAPDSFTISPDAHYRELARSAAHELLLYLVYNTSVVINDEELLLQFQRVFDLNLFPVNYIQQMVEQGSVQPLLDSFDQTARLLPNPPGKKDLFLLAERLKSLRSPLYPIQKISFKQRFEEIISIVFEKLGYEAIYILVDGVDGYVETGGNADKAVEAISWLVTKIGDWREERIYMKYFLPADMLGALENKFPLLTPESKKTIIWTVDTLSEVIRQRLQEASGGKYNSLRAISSLPLRGAKQAPEEVLASEIVKLGDPTPRKLIQAVNKLLIHHAQYEEHEKLTPKDLQAAVDWIRLGRSFKPNYA